MGKLDQALNGFWEAGSPHHGLPASAYTELLGANPALAALEAMVGEEEDRGGVEIDLSQ